MIAAGDGYVRGEFNVIIVPMIALTLHRLHIIPISFYLLSMVLVFFGKIQQKNILHQNAWLSEYQYVDQLQPVTTTKQEETYNFLQFSMVTWLASLMFDAKIIQFIHKDIISIAHDISHNPSLYKVLVTVSLIVGVLSSTMEIQFICSITGDWYVFAYMLFSTAIKILRTIIQGITS